MIFKKWFLSFVAFLIAVASFAQMPELLSKSTMKKLPGVTPVKYKMVFMDEGEVTNLNWKEFIFWLAENEPDKYQVMLLDSNVWREGIEYGEPFRGIYHTHPAYHDYPLVGVSQMQAKAYCEWRAHRIMETEWFQKSEMDSIIFRLPTRNEWQMAARGELSSTSVFPWEGSSIRIEEPKKWRGLIQLNCKVKYSGNSNGMGSKLEESATITTPSYSYWPNTFGLYNMCGNVAEWTQEGYAVGGSWNDFMNQCKIDFRHPRYSDTFRSKTMGFRCVMEVVSFKSSQNIIPVELDAKTIEKSMGFIPDSNQFWLISFTETPQNWYASFLKENNAEVNQIQHQNWMKQTPYLAMLNYGKIESFATYPVVNISHQAANNYCKWIQKKYHSDPKRKYKKVQFRLPTEEEWLYAAQAGNPANPLPLSGDQLRNSKGCYLYNFLPQVGNAKNAFYQAAGAEDGSEYPAKVDAYFPNDYGLYNVSGNVAEMLKSKGLCKGGSWLSKGEDIYLTASSDGYTEPRCDLGFRIVMEVLER